MTAAATTIRTSYTRTAIFALTWHGAWRVTCTATRARTATATRPTIDTITDNI
jgi:hypothetical protein